MDNSAHTSSSIIPSTRWSATETAKFACGLIEIPSLSHDELRLANYLHDRLKELGWEVEVIPVPGESSPIIFVSFGTPRIVFSTHFDVVPAPEKLFTPLIKDAVLYGRGACDAKGILSCMVAAAINLRLEKKGDFGLLFIPGEEVGGFGARAAAAALNRRGIEYLINGEPTEGAVYTAHKGHIIAHVRCSGRSCHSGYPQLGEDANAKAIKVAGQLLAASWGTDEELGQGTINIGVISGGTALNVISSSAEFTVMIRVVEDNVDQIVAELHRLCADEGELTIKAAVPPSRMMPVPGFKLGTAAYATDIPQFKALGAKCVLYGPGTIHVAHTDDEHLTLQDMDEAILGYEKIWSVFAER